MESISTMNINIKIIFVILLIIASSLCHNFDRYKHINVQKSQPQQINQNYLTSYDSQNEDELTETTPSEITFDFELKNQADKLLPKMLNYNSSDPILLSLSSDSITPSSSSPVSSSAASSSSSSLRPVKNIWNDLQSFRNNNYLRSSKSALYITRKKYLKKDWCRTEPLIQKIRIEGCLTKNVRNNFCYGQCNSFYIPKGPNNRNHRRRYNRTTTITSLSNNSTSSEKTTNDFLPEDLTEPAFRSCAYCKPKKFAWVSISLICPRMIPQMQRKQILKIKECKCIAEPLQ